MAPSPSRAPTRLRTGKGLARAASLSFLLLFLLAPAAASASPPFQEENLPLGWEIQGESRVPPEQLAGMAQRLGGKILSVSNQHLSIGGFPVQVNSVEAATEKDAQAILAKLVALRSQTFVASDGATRVYEVVGTNPLVAERVFAALGAGGTATALWKVSFEVALADDLPGGQANRLFNLFLALERGGEEGPIREAVEKESRGLTFGTSLTLLASDEPLREITWHFDPEPASVEAQGERVRATFQDPPRRLGVPYVRVKGEIRVARRFEPAPGAVPAIDRQATPDFPARADEVRRLAETLVAGRKTPRERLLALLRGTTARLAYAGEEGSRHGVLEALHLGVGRCWDRSDLLVTLARAAGLPAREVAGWVPALGAGHVWTEVFLEGEGWIPVDATTTWLGTSVDYVPFFGTDHGEMALLYLSMPVLERSR